MSDQHWAAIMAVTEGRAKNLEEANDQAYKKALQACLATLAADPYQKALDKGQSWADVSEAYEQAKNTPECPWAPKKGKRSRS
jgi:hypothetical protein